MTRILVTGGNGSSGKAMIRYLQKRSTTIKLFCSDLVDSPECEFKTDLSNYDQTLNLVEKTKPDQIYHLAGTFTNDYETDYRGNVSTSKNLLDAIIHHQLKTKVLFIGSAAEYGNVTTASCPITEDTPLKPTSYYGLTKLIQYQLMLFYHQNFNCEIVMARTFNVKAADLSTRLFLGSVYHQIKKVKKGEQIKIKTGNLSFKRDYLEIENITEHYSTIMNHGISGQTYNVASGKSILMRSLLFDILTEEGISHDLLDEDTISYSATSSVSEIYADISKLKELYHMHKIRN